MSQFINEERPIEEFLKDAKTRMSKSYYQNLKVSMRQWHWWLHMKGVGVYDGATTGGIRQYANHLTKQGYASRSVRNKLYDVSKLYQFLQQYDLVEENPVEDYNTKTHKDEPVIKQRTNRTYLTEDEFEQLLSAAENQRDAVLMALMWTTGVRAKEACEITLSDIERDERRIEVETAKQDTYNTRTVYFDLSFDRMLRDWLDKGGRSAFLGTTDDIGYLIPSHSETRMHPSRVNKIVRDTAKRTDLQEKVWETQDGNPQYKVTSHALRHSYAVHSVKQGMSIVFLQDLMGHSDIEQTRDYLRYREEDKQEEAMKYRPDWSP